MSRSEYVFIQRSLDPNLSGSKYVWIRICLDQSMSGSEDVKIRICLYPNMSGYDHTNMSGYDHTSNEYVWRRSYKYVWIRSIEYVWVRICLDINMSGYNFCRSMIIRDKCFKDFESHIYCDFLKSVCVMFERMSFSTLVKSPCPLLRDKEGGTYSKWYRVCTVRDIGRGR